MPMVSTHHVVCDLCGNYAGWNPWPSVLEAITAAKRLGWDVIQSESRTYPGSQNTYAKCSYCLEAGG